MQVVDEVKPERELSRTPLFQTMFVYQNFPIPEVERTEITLSPFMIDPRKSVVDLAVSLMEYKGVIRGWCEFSTQLLKGETVERMVKHYHMILEGVIANPQSRIADLNLLESNDIDRLAYDWNRTEVAYPREKTIHELVEEVVEARLGEVAVKLEGEAVSYEELNRRSNQLAHYLVESGVAVGEVGG